MHSVISFLIIFKHDYCKITTKKVDCHCESKFRRYKSEKLSIQISALITIIFLTNTEFFLKKKNPVQFHLHVSIFSSRQTFSSRVGIARNGMGSLLKRVNDHSRHEDLSNNVLFFHPTTTRLMDEKNRMK